MYLDTYYSYIFCVVYVVIGCIFLCTRKDKTSKNFQLKHWYGHTDSHIVNFNRNILLGVHSYEHKGLECIVFQWASVWAEDLSS